MKIEKKDTGSVRSYNKIFTNRDYRIAYFISYIYSIDSFVITKRRERDEIESRSFDVFVIVVVWFGFETKKYFLLGWIGTNSTSNNGRSTNSIKVM